MLYLGTRDHRTADEKTARQIGRTAEFDEGSWGCRPDMMKRICSEAVPDGSPRRRAVDAGCGLAAANGTMISTDKDVEACGRI